MKGRLSLSPVNALLLLALLAGVVVLLVGSSRTLQDVGFAIAAFAAVGLLLVVVQPCGAGMGRSVAGGVRFARSQDDALTEARHYVAANPDAPEQVWADERAEYAAKEERERRGDT